MSNVELREVHKSYGDVQVIHGINLEIEAGDFVVFVGPSGCGKSTLLRMIAGLEHITGGEVEIAGKVVNDVPSPKRGISMVFQSYALYPHMTVFDNMAFGLKLKKTPKAEIASKVQRAAEILQIEEYLDRYPKALSGGQRQRVAIGRAIVRDPEVFLFDEPLSNLDAALRGQTRMEIANLHSALGATMIYVTHDQIEALTMATKIAVLKEGVLQQFGTPDEVYNKPSNLFVAGFMGSPSMNLIPSKLVENDGNTFVEIKKPDGSTLQLPFALSDHQRGYLGREVIFGIRPENITDSARSDANSASTTTASCSVKYIEPTGSDLLTVFDLADTQVFARLHAGAKALVGQSIELSFDLSNSVIFDPNTTNRID